MKKTIIVFSLLFVLCVPKISYSELDELARDEATRLISNVLLSVMYEKLLNNENKLSLITDDYMKVKRAAQDDHISYTIIKCEMLMIREKTGWIAELLYVSSLIKRDYILDYTKRQIEIINHEKERIHTRLENIIEMSGYVKHKASLYEIDKAKDTIRSLIKIFDETIVILEENMTSIIKQ